MRKFFAFLALSVAVLSANGQARLYDEMCDPLQAVFCDYIESSSSQNVLSEGGGRYVGTLVDGKIYGWGMIVAPDGTMSLGQFRNGKNIFGISMSGDIAKVGGAENYVIYDLKEGGVIRLHSGMGGDMPLEFPLVSSGGDRSPYSFKKETYANGDYYVGELYNGKRHGYGIYYWANGDIWYGRYVDGYRNGYGMLIKADNRVFYGKWLGDSRVYE